MARKTTQVDVIDLSTEPYDPNSTKEKIAEKYNFSGDYTHIYLKRWGKDNKLAELTKYDDLPDVEDIRKEFGGGKYELWIHFNDPNTASGRNFTKVPILIEGTSIVPDYAGTNKPAAAPPVDPEAAEEKLLDKIAKYKVIFGGQQNQENGLSAMLTMMMKQMENQNLMIIEMIKSQGKGSNSKLEEILLTKAFEKNTSDLDIFLKAKKIFESGPAASTDELGWLKEMAPHLLKILTTNKNAGPGPVAGNPNLLQQAAGVPGDQIAAALNNMADVINNMSARLDKIELDVKDIREGIELIPEDEQDLQTESAPGDENAQLVMLNQEQPAGEIDPNDPLLAIADQIRNAPEADQLAALKQWASISGAKDTYEFCLKYGLVKDLAEFNDKMKKAELPPLEL